MVRFSDFLFLYPMLIDNDQVIVFGDFVVPVQRPYHFFLCRFPALFHGQIDNGPASYRSTAAIE